ncbi:MULTISPECIES: hypothetical protein [unclassified Lysinibacillus]|uniref:hypothetical protein n=1 Tax=unclassified Lysinibacillus TaxID=2636778 RepID=UPI00201B3A19|nr:MULTISPECIES: hypothetical protein [unclassified Lysinibacillus]
MTYKFFVNASCKKNFSPEIIYLLMHLAKKNPDLKEIYITSQTGIVRMKFLDKEILDPHYKRAVKGKVTVNFDGDNCYLHFSEVFGD